METMMTRRKLLMGSAAAAALSATVKAATAGKPDADLIALCEEFYRLCDEHVAASCDYVNRRREAVATLPAPPESLADLPIASVVLGRDVRGSPTWCKYARRFLLSQVPVFQRSLPGHEDAMAEHFDVCLEELANYKARCEDHLNGPAVLEARDRAWGLQTRLNALRAELEDRPARTLNGALAKLRAAVGPNGEWTTTYAVLRDLERMAGEA